MLEALAALLEPVAEPIRVACNPYYLYIKFVHVFFVMIWGWSTAVAYGWYVRLAFKRWELRPDEPEIIRQRNFAIEQFDRGVVLEHVAFPLILVTGLMLFAAGGWSIIGGMSWLLAKLFIVGLVFIPMEAVDYWLSHFGGNKHRIRQSGDSERYEWAIRQHWLFLRVTTPVVMTLVPLTIFLAMVKPF